ncbi:RICIN domain-containing protein [Actinoplanes sp. NPDC026619]|uniref:RICIN domain-containing protein n=1 Tax=Actinoplanes sp. NPDC026619 TaxID=3155798 RepID=UPI0033D8E8F0
MVRLPRPSRPVVLGVVLGLVVLTAAGGFAARQAANAAAPLAGNQLSAPDVRILVSAASSCSALTPARLAGQVMVASHFGSRPVDEMSDGGATGVAALTPAQWQENVPWSGADPADRSAAITALAHLTCRLVGQARTVKLTEDPWRVALAAHKVGMEKVVAAGGIPDDAKDYVDKVERYAAWYTLQPALAVAPTAGSSTGAVPDAYVKVVADAGKICTDMPPARIAAQIMLTSGFNPAKVGATGEQGIAQFLPHVWSYTVQDAATKSPWDPSVAIPELARTMCKLLERAGGQYPAALTAFNPGATTSAEAMTKAQTEYAKDTRLQLPKAGPTTTAPSSAAAPSSAKPKPSKTSPTPSRDQPAIKAADVGGHNSYGPYFILNFATKMCIDLPGYGAGTRDGPVAQFTCAKTGDDNQEWTFEPRGVDGDGFELYWIRNPEDGFCIDPPTAEAVASGTELNESGCFDQDNQYFRLEPKRSANGFTYYWLRNTVAGMCIDVPGSGDGGANARLALVPCLANDDHDWALVQKSEW